MSKANANVPRTPLSAAGSLTLVFGLLHATCGVCGEFQSLLLSVNVFLNLSLTSCSYIVDFCLVIVLPDEGRSFQVQPGVRLHRAHLHHLYPKLAALGQVNRSLDKE